jgi:sec-independent protein translocase protein TatC
MPPDEQPVVQSSSADSRMSFGDHLDELRRRIIYSLLGLVVGVAVCLYFTDLVVSFLCQPLIVALTMAGQNPRLYQEQVAQLFLNYMTMSILGGVILASPWISYQLWKFIGTGLYERERKVVKYYGGASLGLFLVGAAFMYFIVMPFAMKYFVEFSQGFKVPDQKFLTPIQKLIYHNKLAVPPGEATSQPEQVQLPILDEPPPVQPGRVWIDRISGQLRYYGADGQMRTETPVSSSLVMPLFNLAEFLQFSVAMMAVFGLGFQTPLVILFMVRMHIVSVKTLRSKRKVVIMLVTIIAAFASPSPDVVSMLLLAVPMWGLFELGLLLGRHTERRREREEAAAGPG